MPLLEAYYSFSIKAVKYLLEKGANPNYNCYRDDDHCPHKCSSVLNAIDSLISEDYTELQKELERITPDSGLILGRGVSCCYEQKKAHRIGQNLRFFSKKFAQFIKM